MWHCFRYLIGHRSSTTSKHSLLNRIEIQNPDESQSWQNPTFLNVLCLLCPLCLCPSVGILHTLHSKHHRSKSRKSGLNPLHWRFWYYGFDGWKSFTQLTGPRLSWTLDVCNRRLCVKQPISWSILSMSSMPLLVKLLLVSRQMVMCVFDVFLFPL